MTDYKAEAEAWLHGLDETIEREGATDATIIASPIIALAYATIYAGEQTAALVEQQRIANLIALEAFKVQQYGSWGGPSLVFGNPATEFGNVPILDEIREGLGLS